MTLTSIRQFLSIYIAKTQPRSYHMGGGAEKVTQHHLSVSHTYFNHANYCGEIQAFFQPERQRLLAILSLRIINLIINYDE